MLIIFLHIWGGYVTAVVLTCSAIYDLIQGTVFNWLELLLFPVMLSICIVGLPIVFITVLAFLGVLGIVPIQERTDELGIGGKPEVLDDPVEGHLPPMSMKRIWGCSVNVLVFISLLFILWTLLVAGGIMVKW